MLEVIYKYLLIVFLIVALVLVSFSGYLFLIDDFTSDTIFIHKIAAILLLITSILHIYIKKKKLKKLTKEFFNIFSNKKVSLDRDMDILLDCLENKTIKDICKYFDLSIKEINDLFSKNNIIYSSENQILKDIEKNNSIKVFSIIVKIIKQKVDSSLKY